MRELVGSGERRLVVPLIVEQLIAIVGGGRVTELFPLSFAGTGPTPSWVRPVGWLGSMTSGMGRTTQIKGPFNI